ncbi:MAG: DUF1638 domain-containing protein [Litoreibacter sp.]
MIPDDQTLLSRGMVEHGNGQILLIACGALAREILAVKATHGWSHMDLKCLPAILHNSPQDITAAVERAVKKHQKDYDRIFIVYADCGTGGLLEAACHRLGVEMIAGPHCYSFFEGNDVFAARDEMTAFYLTDFLVRQYDAFVTKPLGLDKHPELRDMYFGNYEKLVYQAQTEDLDLQSKAQKHAQELGLAYEYRFTGYGDLERTLGQI